MKAIIVKINDKVVAVSQITDLTSKKYVELEQEAKKTFELKDKQILELENEISYLKEYTQELNAKFNYLGKQIAIDRGEIEEDSEEEYVITIEKIKHEQPQMENEQEHPTLDEPVEIVEEEPVEIEPEVSEEEDAYFEELDEPTEENE